MNRPKQFQLSNLLDNRSLLYRLAKEEYQQVTNQTDPIAWLIYHDKIKHPKRFFKDLAQALHIPYIEDIPLPLNVSQQPSAGLDLDFMAKHSLLTYYSNKKWYVVTSNPFLDSTVADQLSQYLPKFTLQIAPTGVIRQAQVYHFHQAAANRAENSLEETFSQVSSKHVLTKRLRWSLFMCSLGLIGTGFIWPQFTHVTFFAITNLLYLVTNPLKAFIFFQSLISSSQASRPTSINVEHLPTYTLLIPLKDEAAVLPKLIKHLRKLKYPLEKLDIKILFEVTDTATAEGLRLLDLGQELTAATLENQLFHIIKVDIGQVSTKPRSCNYALQFARGQLCVIYDAEDRPDPWQLQKAFRVFTESPLNTICVQAKLNFYNSRFNWLTRFFTLEYSFWFEYFLPGLSQMRIPIPLGGTSNHFVTKTLKQIGTWDAYNVTEDADLGWRLARQKYQTAVVDSTTYEEANSQLWNWIKQRTRWQKGFLITFLVHSKSWQTMLRQMGWWRTVSSILVFFSNFFLPLFNPLLWLLFLLSVFPVTHQLSSWLTLPNWLVIVGWVNLILGNLLYLLIHLLTALRLKRYDLIGYSFLMPLYWTLISLATYRALWQTFSKPFVWEKTKHGLS